MFNSTRGHCGPLEVLDRVITGGVAMHFLINRFSSISAFLLSTLVIIQPVLAQSGAVLEEIIVTAQRREQSIQEVPVSLEAYTGDMLNKEGFRSMEDLSNFSPSVELDLHVQNQDIAVRGMATTGNNLGLEQAVPIFVDGVHFGRTSMILGAFLDLERLEVLRGPQPIAFGQNATAGAFNLTTRRPGTEWAGDVTAEYGNWGRASIEGGVGGPITDTLGIRVAGQYDKMNGYIRDVVTADMFPKTKEAAARITLQWQPTESFVTTLKAEYNTRRKDGDGMAVCRSLGEVPLTERAVTIPGLTVFDQVHEVMPYPTDCENGFERVGNREGAEPFFKPVQGIDQEDASGGIVDITSIAKKLMEESSTHDDMDSYNYRLGLNYQLGNGISLDSTTAYIDYKRSSVYDNSSTPIVTNLAYRGEIFNMHSQEIRVLSPREEVFEWEAGVFYQKEDLDLGNPGDRKYQTVNLRANTRVPYRSQISWQDSEWTSAFGSLTYNFLGDRASLDVGARYTDISKQSYIQYFAATWIFDINPDSADAVPGNGIITGTQHTAGDAQRVVTGLIIDCATGNIQCGSYGAGYWTHRYAPPAALRTVPDSWDTRAPVDIGPVLFGIRPANENVIYYRDYNDNSLDPQVTLRYRPSENMSLYAKWARAFKGGGGDIASALGPANQDEFLIDPETAESFELGAKGNLFNNRAFYNITLFNSVVNDLQIGTSVPIQLGGGSATANAGKQRTRGLEFDMTWAATDRLTLGLAGAFMDGVFLTYEFAGCSDADFANADTNGCLTANESLALFGTTAFQGTIDRSGAKAPRTPDWKFVFDADWWMPISDRHKFMLTSKVSFIDGYIFDPEEFDPVIQYPDRVAANLNAGFGDLDDTWNLTFWVRNLFEAGVQYYPEFDADPQGRVDHWLGPRNWRSYGVQLQYNYN